MKDKKKILIVVSIILGSLVLMIGLTYAVFTFNKTSGTSKLIVGDIWMKYEETNGLVLSDAMPTNIDNYIVYKVNPIMETQELNELSRCINIYTEMGIENVLDSGSDVESFCKGYGTIQGGVSHQDFIDNVSLNENFQEMGQELLDAGVIILSNDIYLVNPVIQTQKPGDNELTRCVNLFNKLKTPYDEGTTAELFCKGEGTIINGMTLQQFWIETNQEDGFMDFVGNDLINNNIMMPRIENLPYFEFKISGKNTYTKKDIWYEILLNHGEEHATRTTRIRDDLLRFSLVEIKDGIETTVINNRSYDDLTNKRIFVNTISKNTNEEIEIIYRLYMWIDESTVIGNVREDYTLEEWENVYASIRVDVTGDFNEKEVVLSYEEIYDVTDERCFTAGIVDGNYVLNPNMTAEELNICKMNFQDAQFDAGSDATSFCQGTGTIDGLTFQEIIDVNTFNQGVLLSLKEANIIRISEEVAIVDYDPSCGTDIVIPRTINGYEVTMLGGVCKESIKEPINNTLNNTNTSKNNLVFKSEEFNVKPIAVDCTPFLDTNVTSVVIPGTIKMLGSSLFLFTGLESAIILDGVEYIDDNAFRGNSLTSIKIPNSVKYIGNSVFDGNYLTSVEIPNSVVSIGINAFSDNQLTNVTIGNGIRYMGDGVFNYNDESSIYIDRTCEEIETIPASSKNSTTYFPWVNRSGVSLYGKGGELCIHTAK